MSSANAAGNTVAGNYVGTNAAGDAAVTNRILGVRIDNAHGNVIGNNLLSGNAWGSNGGAIWMNAASGNAVKGNHIGTSASGGTPIANSAGVQLQNGSQGNVVGGTVASEGNVIAYSWNDGVRTHGTTTTGNTITGNSVHSNGGRGIANAWGGNTELAPPIIDSAGGGVSGHTSPKCYPCTVEVFSDDEDEGRIYQGSAATNDDATGTWTYNVTLIGPNITATITDAAGNTSEFSAPAAYSPPAVGGIAELPEVSDPFGPNYLSLTVLAALGLGLVTAGAWYARRRRLG